jgi:hypothetical protein
MTNELKGSVQESTYQSYLIRLWQNTEQGSWRASAQSVQSGHTVLFGEINQLLAFLQRQVSHCAEADAVMTPPDPACDALSTRGGASLLSNDEHME